MSTIPSWVKVGAKVVCVNDVPSVRGDYKHLVAGTVYTIDAVVPEARSVNQSCYVGVHLREVHRSLCPEVGCVVPWNIARFRPVIEPKSEAEDLATFRKWLRVDQPQGEDA